MNELIRNCPKCNIEITYPNKYYAKKAIQRNSLCRRCCQLKYESPKQCIDCGNPILRVSMRCRSCSKKGEFNWVKKNSAKLTKTSSLTLKT